MSSWVRLKLRSTFIDKKLWDLMRSRGLSRNDIREAIVQEGEAAIETMHDFVTPEEVMKLKQKRKAKK